MKALMNKQKPQPTIYSVKRPKKRQWGTERSMTPLSHMHERPSSQKIALSRFAMVLTVLLWVAYVISTILRQLYEGPQSYYFTLEAYEYLIVVTFLTFSSFMYLVARQGALLRFSKHLRVPLAVLEKHFSKKKSAITVLVPSYSEETQVIRKTLLSAALQEYPSKRIVLLLDDNPSDTTAISAASDLVDDIRKLLQKPYERFNQALLRFDRNNKKTVHPSRESMKQLAAEYNWAADWLNELASSEVIEDHVDVFFAEQVLQGLAKDLALTGKALLHSYSDGAQLSRDRMHQLHLRLVWIFGAEVTMFQRKKYASLSHEPNKAMNLNSYIGLMGGSYREELTPDGPVLVKTENKGKKVITIPDTEFLLTLDADSILLKDYCLRLVYFLEQPDNARVAITQTPYSSFRGATSRIERLSGATTDIQHILHQGMSYYGATFWVGANAVIRKQALEDIRETEWIGGFEIKRFIQDRTVIEDTDSSIDLALHGWRLVNYPERLSYSATPSDFGSLIVQRQRWANGGLLIIPKLLAQLRVRKNRLEHVSAMEVMLRLNYIASIAWSNFGLVFLLAYPYDGRLLSPLVLLAAMPYFLAMASDLKYCRYSYLDVIRIYGFNLILLPVNLAGVLNSLQQALTTKKIPFARTPKIKNRTSAGLLYVLAPLFIVGFSLFTMWRNIQTQDWVNALVAGFNAFSSLLAIVSYIGIGNLLVDVWIGLTNMLYVEVKEKDQKSSETTQLQEWRNILYHGDSDGTLPHSSISELIVNSTYDTKE
jgi:cellulose synthase (UDP-forming)